MRTVARLASLATVRAQQPEGPRDTGTEEYTDHGSHSPFPSSIRPEHAFTTQLSVSRRTEMGTWARLRKGSTCRSRSRSRAVPSRMATSDEGRSRGNPKEVVRYQQHVVKALGYGPPRNLPHSRTSQAREKFSQAGTLSDVRACCSNWPPGSRATQWTRSTQATRSGAYTVRDSHSPFQGRRRYINRVWPPSRLPVEVIVRTRREQILPREQSPETGSARRDESGQSASPVTCGQEGEEHLPWRWHTAVDVEQS